LLASQHLLHRSPDDVQAKRERAGAQERSCCLATYFARLRAHRVP
jgi:hypothetical protein